jgi:hypothetical protein
METPAASYQIICPSGPGNGTGPIPDLTISPGGISYFEVNKKEFALWWGNAKQVKEAYEITPSKPLPPEYPTVFVYDYWRGTWLNDPRTYFPFTGIEKNDGEHPWPYVELSDNYLRPRGRIFSRGRISS